MACPFSCRALRFRTPTATSVPDHQKSKYPPDIQEKKRESGLLGDVRLNTFEQSDVNN
jgi:hypothetical protein